MMECEMSVGDTVTRGVLSIGSAEGRGAATIA